MASLTEKKSCRYRSMFHVKQELNMRMFLKIIITPFVVIGLILALPFVIIVTIGAITVKICQFSFEKVNETFKL
jgi:hypothetical protein